MSAASHQRGSAVQAPVDVLKPDITDAADIGLLVDTFYERVFADALLAPVFLEVAAIDVAVHKEFIKAYWEKLLLGADNYHRHTMNIHRALADKADIKHEHFDRWLQLFVENLDMQFEGKTAERARKVAGHIAENMARVMVR